MSMMIEVDERYPEEIKGYIRDYNKGIELQDIMEVGLAVDGLLTLVFHTDKNMRDYAGIVLCKIGTIQPGFLKKGVQVLIHRFKGEDVEKSEQASVILGLISETPAKQLITDADLLKKITIEHTERMSKMKFEEEQKKQFLEKVQKKEIRFLGITGEYLRLGQFYNKLIIDENTEGAQKVVQELIAKTVNAYGSEETLEDFEMGCTTFSIMATPENREPVIEDLIQRLPVTYENAKKKQKEGMYEFLINTIKSTQDILPQKYKMELLSEANKRDEEKKKEGLERIKEIQQIQRLSINIDVTWEKQVKDLSNIYNEALKNKDEKELAKSVEMLKGMLSSKDPYLKKSAIGLYSQFLEKNFELLEDYTKKLVKNYKASEASEILSENLKILTVKGLIDIDVGQFLAQEKAKREAIEKEEKEKKRKEFEKIEKLKVEFSAEWDKRIVDLVESINNSLINEKRKDAEKNILGSMKNYIYAEDPEISKQAIEFLNNIAKKYPDIIQKIMKELIDLFKSEHERRHIAVDLLGLLAENPNKAILFKGYNGELFAKLKEDVEERQKAIQQAQLMDKWDAIKLEVTTIIINLEHDKKLQKICRAYNEGIQAKDKEKVIKNVQIIVDWFLEEKDTDKLDQVIEVLGKIAKQNIELIAPAIDMFLKMVDSEDKDKKFRAIKGLGEITYQRPGWAYMGISKLIEIVTSDEDENARRNALIELSRIGRANATMLIEHIDAIINSLRDPDKQVRRLGCMTIGAMAEVIPLEAKEAIPALREALHDEYHLVRMFADKALKLIRSAMRQIDEDEY